MLFTIQGGESKGGGDDGHNAGGPRSDPEGERCGSPTSLLSDYIRFKGTHIKMVYDAE